MPKIGAAAFQGEEDDVFRYEFKHAQTGEPLGAFCLRGFKQATLDRYRDIRNGNGRSKGDNPKARAFLFRKTYVRFEFYDKDCELDLGDYKNDVDFFLGECQMAVDAVVQQHTAAVFPEVDEKK